MEAFVIPSGKLLCSWNAKTITITIETVHERQQPNLFDNWADTFISFNKRAPCIVLLWVQFYNALFRAQIKVPLGRGGVQVVSVLAFYSDDLSSNSAKVYHFWYNLNDWPTVLFVPIKLHGWCWISHRLNCMVKSKLVKKEVSRTGILPLSK